MALAVIHRIEPTLEHQALTKIVISVWTNNGDAFSMIDLKFSGKNCEFRIREWTPIENRVIQKVNKMEWPSAVKKKLIALIRPIGQEIYKWKEYQDAVLPFKVDKQFLMYGIANLVWSAYGTVDPVRTAKRIIENESFSIALRYTLACHNCLEDDIRLLWRKLSGNEKKEFLKINSMPDLVTFWAYKLSRNPQKLLTSVRYHPHLEDYAFFQSVDLGNGTAVEFFWKKMCKESRKIYFMLSMDMLNYYFREMCCFHPRPYTADVIRFLISAGLEDMGELLMGVQSSARLVVLLEFPYQRSFIDVGRQIMTKLGTTDIVGLAQSIIHRIVYSFQDFDYGKVFRDLSEICRPRYVVEIFMSELVLITILPSLFEAKDFDTIRMISKKLSPEKRVQAMFHSSGVKFCYSLAHDSQWELLSDIVSSFLDSKGMLKFRDRYFIKRITRATSKTIMEYGEDVTPKIFSLITELANSSKRSLEGGQVLPLKRFRKDTM